MPYDSEKEVAIAAVRAAAQLCEQVRRDRTPDTIAKQDRSPVTIADFGAQAIICRRLAQAFPTDPILAEETATLLRQPRMSASLQQITTSVQAIVPTATTEAILDWIDWGKNHAAESQTSDRLWTLDPIDGTKGFLRGDQYAIALALIEQGEVKVGVMACPALPVDSNQPTGQRGVVFVGVRGQGAERLPLAGGESQILDLNHTGSIPQLIESVELDHGNPSLQRQIAESVGLLAPPIQMDSLAKYGVLAAGGAALYLRLSWVREPNYRENIWDHAAGTIVVEEAGGRVSDMHGQRLDFSHGTKLLHNRGIVASNGLLHEKVLAAIREFSQPDIL